MEKSNMFGYGEVNQYQRNSTLMSAYKNIKDEKFHYYILKQKADVYHAMKSFFKRKLKRRWYDSKLLQEESSNLE